MESLQQVIDNLEEAKDTLWRGEHGSVERLLLASLILLYRERNRRNDEQL